MAFEEGISLVWAVILGLAITTTVIGFLLYMRGPTIQTAWLSGLVTAMKWLITPPV